MKKKNKKLLLIIGIVLLLPIALNLLLKLNVKEPTPDNEPVSYRIVGSMNNWNYGDTKYEFKLNEQGEYYIYLLVNIGDKFTISNNGSKKDIVSYSNVNNINVTYLTNDEEMFISTADSVVKFYITEDDVINMENIQTRIINDQYYVFDDSNTFTNCIWLFRTNAYDFSTGTGFVVNITDKFNNHFRSLCLEGNQMYGVTLDDEKIYIISSDKTSGLSSTSYGTPADYYFTFNEEPTVDSDYLYQKLTDVADRLILVK